MGCVEHVWRVAGLELDLFGVELEWVCDRCGVELVEGQDALRGVSPV